MIYKKNSFLYILHDESDNSIKEIINELSEKKEFDLLFFIIDHHKLQNYINIKEEASLFIFKKRDIDNKTKQRIGE
jgi:hypothetical protein